MTGEIKTAFRILTFRATREEFQGLNRKHLTLGLVMTWLVGIGRWWEDPRANWLQHLGFGSVVYIFALALFLRLILWPLTTEPWTYFNVLTFVSRQGARFPCPIGAIESSPAFQRWVNVSKMDSSPVGTAELCGTVLAVTVSCNSKSNGRERNIRAHPSILG